MEHLINDLDVSDDKDPGELFNKIASEIEKLVLSGSVSYLYKEQMLQMVETIERKLQDLVDLKLGNTGVIINTVYRSLHEVIGYIRQSNVAIDYEILYRDLFSIHQYIIGQIEGYYEERAALIRAMRLTQKPNDQIDSNSVAWAKIGIANHNRLNFEPTKISNSDAWNFELYLENENDQDSVFTLWTIMSALESIDGVKVEIEEIKKGSLWAKLKVTFTSPQAKEEAEKLIESAKRKVHGTLEKEHFENEKKRSEVEKIQAETEMIKTELEEKQSDYERSKKDEELRSIKIENDKKELELELLKLKVFKERIDAVAKLVADNIIDSRQARLYIDDILQIDKKEDGTIEIGPELTSPDPE